MPALGRNIVIHPGQAAPEGWGSAAHVVVGSAELNSPAALIARLRRMADDREACVFELDDAVDAALAEPQTNDAEIHDVGPRFTFEVSALRHLVWSNSVDGRDPDHPVWQLTDIAIGLGAEPGTRSRRRVTSCCSMARSPGWTVVLSASRSHSKVSRWYIAWLWSIVR